MSSGATSSATVKNLPKDALVNEAILREMGVTDYEPRLINQMLEFTYRYVSDILEDAKAYSQHANKKNIDIDDVKLAVQCKLDHSFTNPPPRDLLLDVARLKNSTPLPLIKPYSGPRLPPDRYCLTTPNFRLNPYKKPKTGGVGAATNQKFSITQTAVAKPGAPIGPTLSLVTKSAPGPTFSIKPGGTSTVKPPMPIIRVTPGVPGSASLPGSQPLGGTLKTTTTTGLDMLANLKRKREDDLDL